MAIITAPRVLATAAAYGAYQVVSTDLEGKDESQEVAEEGSMAPLPQDRREDPLPLPLSEQIERSRQAISAEQAKKEDGLLWTTIAARNYSSSTSRNTGAHRFRATT